MLLSHTKAIRRESKAFFTVPFYYRLRRQARMNEIHNITEQTQPFVFKKCTINNIPPQKIQNPVFQIVLPIHVVFQMVLVCDRNSIACEMETIINVYSILKYKINCVGFV